ncbi:hypothetical protein JK361_27720 [Streptomyces sp. 5-8]|uniref:Uncharacterized protein n=1 Tax=Streptomyces musisoli TaxID=2802280 RepID=A0ABS1P7K3_9ACTN|nr:MULTISPECIES: hypothetical protein [Streptomyces]MBL1108333.1 hypothetical protein [Streptomyces musisoli]MBY8845537.1 hypothetical protein [Streptomyces sp. SP2-10]
MPTPTSGDESEGADSADPDISEHAAAVSLDIQGCPLYAAAADVAQIAGAGRKEKSQFAHNRRPEGHGAEVDQVVAKLDELSQTDGEFSTLLLQLTNGEEVFAAEQAWLKKREKVAAPIRELDTRLGATQCFRKGE